MRERGVIELNKRYGSPDALLLFVEDGYKLSSYGRLTLSFLRLFIVHIDLQFETVTENTIDLV